MILIPGLLIAASATFAGHFLDKFGQLKDEGKLGKKVTEWRYSEWGAVVGGLGAASTFVVAVVEVFV